MSAEAAARLAFAASLGAATFFAPCAFPLLPGYLAFYLGTGAGGPGAASRAAGSVEPGGVDATTTRLRRAALLGVAASAGFLAVFGAVGGAVAAVGTGALSEVSLLEPVVGLVLVVLGVATATGRVPSWELALPGRRRAVAGFFLFGVGYAATAAGCTAALFVAAVGTGLAAGPALGAATLLAYAGGMSAVLVAVTVLASLGRDRLLRVLSRSTGRVERVAGVLLALAGAVQVGLYLFWLGGLAALAG